MVTPIVVTGASAVEVLVSPALRQARPGIVPAVANPGTMVAGPDVGRGGANAAVAPAAPA